MRSNLSVINVYKKKSIKSKLLTQLLYGESFKLIKKNGLWIKIKNDSDSYKGFIKKNTFPSAQVNTHKVCNLFAYLYKKPSLKYKIKKKISFGSRVKVVERKKNFYKFDNFWIKKKDLKEKKYKTKDLFQNIKKFINTKYIWGGKHYSGVDCSGLIQILLNFNNRYCPRDSKDQIRYFKKTNLPLLLNTSFNLKGEPIVDNPIKAISTFLRSKCDVLYIGNFKIINDS